MSNFSELHEHTTTSGNTTLGGNKASLLNSGMNGALVMLKMDRGDTIDLSVNASYETNPDGNGFTNSAYNALFGQWDGAIGSGAEGGGIPNGTSGAFDNAFTDMGLSDKGSSVAPRAFLNYIIFDLDMGYVTSGFQQISTNAAGVGVHEQVAINDIIAEQGSYLLAYVSNENQDS